MGESKWIYRAQRFSPLGLHPVLDKQGNLKYKLAPGQYNPTYNFCESKNRPKKSRWKIETECEEFSRNLGYGNTDKLAERIFMSKHLGPGSHEVNEDLFRPQQASPCQNQMFGRQKRFATFANNVPAPGTYKPHNSTFCCRPKNSTFARAERWKDSGQKWSLAPNRYAGKMNKIEIAVVESEERAPQQKFRDPRDPLTIANHLAPGKRCTPDKYYSLPTHLEELLKHPRYKNRGCFLRAKRYLSKPNVRMLINDLSMCYKNPKWPSPATYNVTSDCIKKLPEALYPFGITSMETRPGVNEWKVSPGPGRYTITNKKCHMRKVCGSYMFKSKTQRPTYEAVQYNAY